MLRTIIIDDEEHQQQRIEKMAGRFCPDLEVAATDNGVGTGVEAIKKHGPGLVLVNIKLRDGTGF